MYLNHSNIIRSFKASSSPIQYDDHFYRYEAIRSDGSPGGVTKGCTPEYFSIPVTFKNSKSFAKLTGYEGSYSMNVSLEFRTYEENGLLVYHGFSSEGFVKVNETEYF